VGTQAINEQQVHEFLAGLFGEDLHAKRVLSLCLATLGVIHAASLSVYAIAQALAVARGKKGKHGVKQVDRLLSNTGVDVWHLFSLWVPYVMGQRTEAVVALDWTDFDKDDHTTLVASLRTGHGRSTPLVWLTVHKSALKGMRNDAEDSVLLRLRELIAPEVKVTILADRGFADQKLYALLEELRFEYVVRFRQRIIVTSTQGERRSAAQWVPTSGHLRKLKGARVTADEVEVAAVVCVKKKGMKEPWCLAASLAEASGAEVVALLSALLTLLGAAGESLGMERDLSSNASPNSSASNSFSVKPLAFYEGMPQGGEGSATGGVPGTLRPWPTKHVTTCSGSSKRRGRSPGTTSKDSPPRSACGARPTRDCTCSSSLMEGGAPIGRSTRDMTSVRRASRG
jgi:hypothetical protein